MAHLIDKSLIERANTALLLGILWAALGTCVVGALAYDTVTGLRPGETRSSSP
jgi:hypothetical protein